VPTASNLNFSAGETRANNAFLSLAADGSGQAAFRVVIAAGGTAELIVDLVGYFE
jgi:hypothetical protein